MLVAYMEYRLWCVKEGFAFVIDYQHFLKYGDAHTQVPGFWVDEPNGSYSRGYGA